MTTQPITPVILCGGNGTRLWPRSRATKPKPFLPLVGDGTLFEQAIRRCAQDRGFATPIVVTGRGHLAHVLDQLGSGDALVIVEPAARNTAAAIALAALRLPDEAVMLVCPSDHHIGNASAFQDAAKRAAGLAATGLLVSLGIKPVAPETGYGYLKRGTAIGDRAYRVEQFVEKPDLTHAQSYLAHGGYAWNGGIFAFRVRDYLAELGAFRPDILNAVRQSVEAGQSDGQCFFPESAAFGAIDGDSVDYVVMEKTSRAAMVDADMDWSDIGSWQALHSARHRDADGNSVTGDADIVDCRNILVDSDGPRVSVIGLDNVIVVVDGDDVVVTSAAAAQRVGKLPGAVNQ